LLETAGVYPCSRFIAARKDSTEPSATIRSGHKRFNSVATEYPARQARQTTLRLGCCGWLGGEGGNESGSDLFLQVVDRSHLAELIDETFDHFIGHGVRLRASSEPDESFLSRIVADVPLATNQSAIALAQLPHRSHRSRAGGFVGFKDNYVGFKHVDENAVARQAGTTDQFQQHAQAANGDAKRIRYTAGRSRCGGCGHVSPLDNR
jgi:hypothetical protein